MSAAQKLQPISVEDYLAGELAKEKHEYLGGYIHAMAGGTNAHDRIASNVLGAFHAALNGKQCEPFNSDTKIRVMLPAHTRFYYPDVSVVCEPNSPQDSFQDRPVIIVEVLSTKTRRVDQLEKKEAYLTIPTLGAYLLVEQEYAAVTVHRRSDHGFVQEAYDDLTDTIQLGEIDVNLPLAEIYARVEFAPEREDEEN